MAELDVNAYATTSTNAAAGAPTIVETQQPGGTGALRQVTVNADAVTRANMQTVKAASTAAVAADMGAVVHLHPSSPATQTDTSGTGTISATDALGGTPSGTGTLISTAPTASSFVALALPGGTSQIDVQILGTATGTYYFEYSMDSTTGSDGAWVTGLFRQSGINNTVLTLGATTNGIFRGAAAAFKYFRLRNVGGTTPSNAITIRTSNGSGTTFLNAALPGGSNIVGKVGIDQTTPGTTNLVALAANQSVNNAQVNGVAILTGTGATGTGAQRVTVATDTATVAGSASLPTGTNTIGAVNIAATQTLATVTTVGAVTAITNALPTGTNTIGRAIVASSATGGTTAHTLISAATTNATSVKASAGTVYSIQASNTGAAVAFLKLFNLAAAPTVGTSVAVKTLILPAGGGTNIDFTDIGSAFSTGIAYSITGLATTADTTAVALAQVVINIDYV